MTGFLSKIFGKKENKKGQAAFVDEMLHSLIEKMGLDLDFEMKEDNGIFIEFFGADEEMVVERDGQLLDALQLYVKRMVQHHFPEDPAHISMDCGDFRAQANEALIELAEKLKGVAIEKGRSVYFRALPPKDRKVIHQYLASDGRVKSRSIGDGLYKKIKIYPVKNMATASH